MALCPRAITGEKYLLLQWLENRSGRLTYHSTYRGLARCPTVLNTGKQVPAQDHVFHFPASGPSLRSISCGQLLEALHLAPHTAALRVQLGPPEHRVPGGSHPLVGRELRARLRVGKEPAVIQPSP